jgi:hypothetical protein
VKLSPVDSTNNFPNVLRALKSGELKIKLYGRLKDLNESLLEQAHRVPTPRPNTPCPVIVSAIIQIALLAEPIWRAIKLDSLVSIVGSSLIIAVGCFLVLKATAYRKRWARDGLAVLAFLGFVWAVVSGALFATDHPELRLAALTSIPNLIAIALLYTPTVDRWFNEGASNKMSRPR